MNIYLASRYSRREELCKYRQQIQSLGGTVTSRWLNGQHQISDTGVPIGEAGESLIEGDNGDPGPAAAELRQRFALEDLEDLQRADLCICFTEPPRSTASRGGRHVELGVAIAQGTEIWIVGYRENLFCWLTTVRFFDTWWGALDALQDRLLETP